MPLTSLARLLTICFIFEVTASAQTTWYVDIQATPPGNGTPASPYTSIQHAIASPTTHVGDTVLVAPGTYVGAVTVHNPVVYLRSTAGPASTTIKGFVLADGIGGDKGSALVEGFTILSASGIDLGGATLRHCIVRPPDGMGPGERGVLFDDYTIIRGCVFTRYHQAFQMFSYATFAAEIRDTIVTEADIVLSASEIANLTNCCLPSIPTGWGITTTGTLLGDPGFKDPANRDYHLLANSICIDAGSPSSPHDPDGSVADIGALPADPQDLQADFVYCTSELNGDGCYGLVQSSGVCSATSGLPYILSAHGLPPNKLGRLIYSDSPANTPFQGGTLCLGNPLHRTDPTYSGSNGLPPPLDQCSGVLTFDFNARIQSGIDSGLVVGRHVYAQFRYRDPHDPLGFAVGWTDAIRFVIAP